MAIMKNNLKFRYFIECSGMFINETIKQLEKPKIFSGCTALWLFNLFSEKGAKVWKLSIKN